MGRHSCQQHLILVLALILPWTLGAASSSYYSWNADNVTITGTKSVVTYDPSAYTLRLRSNRKVVSGGYRLSLIITANQSRINTNKYKKRYYLNTTCIPYHAKSVDIQAQLSQLLLNFYTVNCSFEQVVRELAGVLILVRIFVLPPFPSGAVFVPGLCAPSHSHASW